MSHLMRVGPYGIGIHFPPERKDQGRSLAPTSQWPVHDVADYTDRVPEGWNVGTPTRGGFFFGTEEGRELWFDFRPMQSLPDFLAVTLTVQGVNAVTGLPSVEGVARGHYVGRGIPTLEQYRVNCPIHERPMGAHRLCDACGFRWPAQNYITNAAGSSSVSEFWRDGWRTAVGEIRQFVLRAAAEQVGVAQQMLGASRTLAIDIAVFRSSSPKPPPPPPMVHESWDGRIGSFGGGRLGSSEVYGSGSFDGIGASLDQDLDMGDVEPQVSRSPRLKGSGRPAGARAMSRIGAPERMEVAAGRQVDQVVHEDTHELDFWHPEPVALFTLFPTDQAWVQQVVKDGPTTRVIKGGAFAGVRPAG